MRFIICKFWYVLVFFMLFFEYLVGLGFGLVILDGEIGWIFGFTWVSIGGGIGCLIIFIDVLFLGRD